MNILNYFQRDDSTFFALCANGVIYKSNNTAGIVGLDKEESLMKKNIQILPNPAFDQIEIKIDKGIRVESIRLFDINGKVVYENSRFKNTIDIEEYKSGIYVVELFTQKGKIQQKFLKQ